MGKKIINLDRVITSMIHYPKIEGIPLYTRVDGKIEQGDNSFSSDKSTKWIEASKRSYGSPDNIRKLFITNKAVYVHLYRPVVGVKNNISLKRETNFPIAFSEIYNDIVSAQTMGKQPSYEVRQTGLGALCKPWVCSNIEEIYFDWTIFLSTDIMNLGMGDFFQLYKPGTVGMLPAEPIKVLFDCACLKGIKNVQDRFPRLRCIGYIEHLEKIYHNIPSKSGAESLEDSMKPWYANMLVGAAIKDPNSTVAIYNIPGVKKLNDKYSVKDGIYMFDREILLDYFSNLSLRIKEYSKNEKGKEIEAKKSKLVEQVKNTKSSLETTLDEIYIKEGPEKALIALKIAMNGIPKQDKIDMIKNMSHEGQIKYKRLLGV